MRDAIAGMKMGRNLGHVATAIAPSGWKKNWGASAIHFWKISIQTRAIPRSSPALERSRFGIPPRGAAVHRS
jgi:hypothetical protein